MTKLEKLYSIIGCLDTFAMVKIWEKLKDTAKEMP